MVNLYYKSPRSSGFAIPMPPRTRSALPSENYLLALWAMFDLPTCLFNFYFHPISNSPALARLCRVRTIF
jgi:hypothetical protein